MRGRFIPGLLGYLCLVLALGCGSSNGGSGFGAGDSGIDVSVNMDARSLLMPDGSHGGMGGKDTGGTMRLGGGDSSATGTCPTAVTCTTGGQKCGTISDGCGGTLQCGGCTGNDTCGGGGTANECGTACQPKSCAEQNIGCGPAGDGCGNMIQCGGCDAGTCGGGGTPSQCGTSTTPCTPTTCMKLGDNCGMQADGCGGTLNCGTCDAGTCGGGGVPSQCGMVTCVPKSCTDLGITCGETSNGCNGSTGSCGTCTAPQACGGGGTFGKCGCTGTCSQEPTCTGTATTTLSGYVYDPADIHPLYNALVYVPNDPTDSALTTPFAAGISCEQCGASAAGDPLVTVQTAPNGSFTLSGVPVGSGATAIPLVIELGRWRRQFTVNVTTSCGANTIASTNTTPIKWQGNTPPAVPADGHLTMPTSSLYGDIPRIAMVTGSFDPIECVLRKMGLEDSEFVNPGGAGHIQFYLAADPNAPSGPDYNEFYPYTNPTCPGTEWGYGAAINGSTPSQSSLFATTGGPGGTPEINNYDVTILACEGYEEDNQSSWAALGSYTAAGGRVLDTHFAYDWMAQSVLCPSGTGCPTGTTCDQGECKGNNNVTENPAYAGVATWSTYTAGTSLTETATIDEVSNPVGTEFDQWLQDVGDVAAGKQTMSLDPVMQVTSGVIAPTQQWLYWGSEVPIEFTFNTPLNAAPADQCGRVNYMSWHADTLNLPPPSYFPNCPYTWDNEPAPYYGQGLNFPTECDSGPMTAQEAVVEFMLFDVSSCVTPYQATCTSESCAQQGIDCGPAGDGCGNLLQCGTCPAGETCGGGGSPGVCGTPTCTPTTCTAQNIGCGTAGNGCGGTLDCGTCPTGQTCGGGGTPGKCGSGGTCTPESCTQQDIECGPAGNGCGVEIQCGDCTGNESCGGGGTPGKCGTTCVPTSCGALDCNCGPQGDGCGNQLNCGTCTGGETCGGGGVACQCGTGGPK
jgi:hypothetical protein